MSARLVLIEGMVGAGKSTTARQLARGLQDRGEDARAYDEFAPDHPIRTQVADRLLGVEEANDPGVYDLRQWNALADRCVRGTQTVILEAAFLQNSVLPHLSDDAPPAVVKDVFADIAARIAPAAPLLIYLRPADVGEAIRRVHAERGEPWSSRNLAFGSACAWARRRGLVGEAAVIALYSAWEPIVDELLPTMDSLLLVDPQRDWERALQRIDDRIRSAP